MDLNLVNGGHVGPDGVFGPPKNRAKIEGKNGSPLRHCKAPELKGMIGHQSFPVISHILTAGKFRRGRRPLRLRFHGIGHVQG